MNTTSTNTQSNNRIIWIDIAKGIGILAMLIGHNVSFLEPFIYSFHMPLFFILAGFTIKAVEKEHFLDQLYKDIKRLVLPCLIAGIIVLIGNCLIKNYSFILEAKVMVVSWIWGNHWGTFFGRSFPSIGRIWFLLALFWTRWFYRFLLRFVKEKIRLPLLIILSFFSMLMGSKGLVLPHSFDMIFICALFTEIGHRIKHYDLSKVKWWIMAISALVWITLSCFANIWIDMNHRKYPGYYLCIVVAMLGCFIVFKFSQTIEKHTKVFSEFLSFWGRNSIILLVIQSIAPYFFIGQTTFQIVLDMIVECLLVVIYHLTSNMLISIFKK